VTYQEQRHRTLRERGFKAFDRRQIEMIGRLVHYDKVRPAENSPREQQLSDFTGAWKRGFEKPCRIGVEPSYYRHQHAEIPVAEAQDPLQAVARRGRVNLLGYVDDTVGGEVVRVHDPAHQGGLPGPVAPRQPDAVALSYGERGCSQYPAVTERHGRFGKRDDERAPGAFYVEPYAETMALRGGERGRELARPFEARVHYPG